MNKVNLEECLEWIDPSALDYASWVQVGQALKQEGYDCSVWDDWSHRDYARYHSGECERKWDTFNNMASGVTGGTIVHMAQEFGWSPVRGGHEIGWDDIISNDGDDYVVVKDSGWLEGREVVEPKVWNPAKELITYLETLFDSTEYVGYVCESWERDGRYMPTKGYFDRTAGELIDSLNKCNGDIGSVMGDYKKDVGAWIRFNPLDGKGIRNDNVTDFRYALVESDTMELEKQHALIRELELPVACLVYSGGKSIHAIVKINAQDYNEYRKRVDFLYSILKKNGLQVDIQNKNPSRLSRMPGVERKGKKQFLMATNIGKASWEEWKEWIEGINDDLPDPSNLADDWDNMPPLAEPLIEGVLRKGHKMLIAGPSKAGKSFGLIELCISIAEGQKWLGFQCARGRVLYVNLELDSASCLHRFKDVYEALGWNPTGLGNIDIWNLRGKSVPMDSLAPKLIRRALKKNYIAVVIDPIYKVITGDENSADQMAAFCNQFDKVCTELECAVIYCHHHSKGAQGGKKAMDRASGSGVFARDPDAMLDLIELELPENVHDTEMNKVAIQACQWYLNKNCWGWKDAFPVADMLNSVALMAFAEQRLTSEEYNNMLWEIEARKRKLKGRTAWRLDGTLREFPSFEPVNMWFQYPVHILDEDGVLDDLDADGEKMPWELAMEKRQEMAEQRRIDKEDSFHEAVANANNGEPPTLKQVLDWYINAGMKASEKTIRRRMKELDYQIDKNTMTIKKTRDME